MTNPAAELNQAVLKGASKLEELAAFLDAATPTDRLAAVRGLGPRAQASLFEAAQGARALTLDDMVPKDVAPLTPVAHQGRNSLPLFRHFAKVFCRPGPESTELWGYNATGFIVRTFVGPGYYVAYRASGGEILIDYTRLPTAKPDAWPPIKRNDAGLSRFVYGGMTDLLRGVSRHVSIGRAIRGGAPADNWFVLCRDQ